MTCYIKYIGLIHNFRTGVMLKTKVVALTGCLLLLAGISGGCKKKVDSAFLELHPRILIHESHQGSGKNLKLTVVDKRRYNVLIKKDSERKIKSGRALITKDFHPAIQVDANFQQVAEEAFQMQGYQMDGKGTGSTRELSIYIIKLDLKFRKEKSMNGEMPQVQARLRSKLKVSARNRGISYGGEYEFFIKKSYSSVPEKIVKEKILNYGLTQLLYQMLDDPKLANFLTG